MEVDRSTDAIAVAHQYFEVESIDDPESLDEVFRLRYQVYCVERGFEPGCNGQETDRFDSISRHVLLRHRSTGIAVGTVRLVIPRLGGPAAKLPLEQVIDPPRLRALPRSRIAEVSRFALSKELRAGSARSGSLARLALIRGIVQLSACMRVTHWCALMEPKLLRLLSTSGIHFMPMARLVEHHGLRQPSVVELAEMLERVYREKPEVWDFITDGGMFWRAGPTPYAA